MQATLTDTTETVTLPAFADTLGETITVTVPADVADLVRAMAPALVYGPTFRRWAVDTLRDAARATEDYPDVARDRIVRAHGKYELAALGVA